MILLPISQGGWVQSHVMGVMISKGGEVGVVVPYIIGWGCPPPCNVDHNLQRGKGVDIVTYIAG